MTPHVKRICAAAALLLGTNALAQTYKITGEYKLPGGAAHAIAVDSESRKIFVAGDDGVTVLNADTGAQMGSIPLKGAQDVLLVPVVNGEEVAASTTGFATAQGRAVRFSVADMKVASEARLPQGAGSLCYDDDTRTIEVVDAGGTLSTLDAESGKLLRSARVPAGAGQIACGTLGHVYVADTANNVVHVLNHETGRLDGDYPIMTGHKPSGLTLDTKGRRLFVACEDGTIEIIDTDSGFTFIELRSGSGPARGTFAWTPQGKGQWKAAAFFVHQDGTLTGVRMMAYINYTIGGSYKLTPGLNGVAYDAKTHRLLAIAGHGGSPVVEVVGY
jgi:DNA-binding beta-propeller fold protein YncE